MFLKRASARITHKLCYDSAFSQNIHNDEMGLASLLEPF
jgi:hypothetical protein